MSGQLPVDIDMMQEWVNSQKTILAVAIKRLVDPYMRSSKFLDETGPGGRLEMCLLNPEIEYKGVTGLTGYMNDDQTLMFVGFTRSGIITAAFETTGVVKENYLDLHIEDLIWMYQVVKENHRRLA